jgi:thioredoxin reductase
MDNQSPYNLSNTEIYDVIIVGAGPAGLNAALILARCLRKILVFDHGKPRNWKSDNIHGFLSRDGFSPKELLNISKQQLGKYDAEIFHKEVIDADLHENFIITDSSGNKYHTRKLLLASGLMDIVPKIDGIERFYGKSIHHCAYCDGYEVKDKTIAIYGNGKSGVGLSKLMTIWSQDVVYFSDGQKITKEEEHDLASRGVVVEKSKIRRLEGSGDELESIVLENGDVIPRQALFFTTQQYQRSHLADKLLCNFTKNGVVKTDRFQQTNISGLYVAGDAARDVQLAIVAAAEGAKAGVIINQELAEEDITGKKVENKYDLKK